MKLRSLFLSTSLPDAKVQRIIVESFVIAGLSVLFGFFVVMGLHDNIYERRYPGIPSAAIIFMVAMYTWYTLGFPVGRAVAVAIGAALCFWGLHELFNRRVFWDSFSFRGLSATLLGFWMVLRFYSEGSK